ncbi:MAG: hypothetical protein AB7F88_11210 [Pyrinomonadaceae bacterium]
MQTQKRPGRLGRRGKVVITLGIVLGTLGLLLYFEQLAIIYIGSTMALIVLLIVVAFSDLEKININAAEEAYLTNRSEGVFPDGEIGQEGYDKDSAAAGSQSPRRLSRREA